MRELIGIFAFLLTINVAFYTFVEDLLVYHPSKSKSLIEQTGMDYENVYLNTSDGEKIHGWFVKADNTKKILLFFHGNAADVNNRLPIIKQFINMGINVFIIDYHGYGQSSGKPNEKNLYLDSIAAYNYLIEKRNYKPKDIVVFGRSLGGAVAIDLASKVQVGKLLIESSFAKISDFIPLPLKPVIYLKSSFNSEKKIKNISIPKLFIHSKADTVVPYGMGVKLFKAAAEPKKLVTLEKWQHCDYITEDKYEDAIKGFIE